MHDQPRLTDLPGGRSLHNPRLCRAYLIRNVSGLTSPQLMYIPTTDELAEMPFVSEENRAAFEEFINSDSYLSSPAPRP